MSIKKRGKAFVINSIFIMVVITSLILIMNSTPKITGMQVMDATTAKMKLETALQSSAFAGMITQGSICVSINDPAAPLNFQAVKSGTSWTVTEEDQLFCQGEQAHDLIILFKNHGDFSRMMDDPSPRNLINGAMLQTFEILPSRYVQSGGNVVCDASFRIKFCDALNQAVTPEQLIDGDLVCCLDDLSRSQRKQLEEHLQSGSYSDEIGILQQPASGFSMTSLFILIVILVVVGGGAAGFFLFGKKSSGAGEVTSGTVAGPASTSPAGAAASGSIGMMPEAPPTSSDGVPVEPVGQAIKQAVQQNWDPAQVAQLKAYALETLQQGYTPEQLYEHFVEQGWDQVTAREAINEAIQQLYPNT